MHIRLIPRSDLDVEKWGSCIDASDHSSIYGKSWYLDIFTDNDWWGLVVDDYDAVMPLYIKRKWKIDYIIQPFLCQQVGLFGKKIDESTTTLVYKFIIHTFKFYHIFVHEPVPNFISTQIRNNQILDLNVDSAQLRKGYNRNTKRNIHFAESKQLNVELTNDIENTISFLKTHDDTGLITVHQTKIHTLLTKSLANNAGLIYRALLQKETVSMAYFIKENSTYYFLLCASSPVGKDTKALYLIVDTFIRHMSTQNCILDFTGSQIPNIARRNEGFGAVNIPYFQVQSQWYRWIIPIQKFFARFL